MKKLQNLFAASVLLFMLSVSALAGDIHTDFVPPPPPPPELALVAGSVEGVSLGAETAAESDSLVTEITLSLLQLLSVF